MVLRNYYNMLALYMMGVTNTDTTTFGDGHLNVKVSSGSIKPLEGVTVSASYDSINYRPVPSFGTIRAYGIVTNGINSVSIQFGTGSTAVTFDDYKLDSPITSGISISAIARGTPTYDSSTRKWTNTFSCVVYNSSSSSITVSEVGIFSYGYNGMSASELVYREVLSTPFTVAAGESVNYTQNLEFTMPTIS